MNGTTATARRPSLRLYPGPVLFPAVGGLFLLLAVWTWFANPYDTSKGFPKFAFGLTGAMFLFTIMAIARWRSYEVSLTVGDQAVIVNGREFRYDRIDSLSLNEKPINAIGQRENNAWRTLAITAERKTKTWMWLGREGDPMPAAVQTAVDRLADEARRRTIRGKGWSLEQTTLRIKDDAVPLSTLTGAGVFDREVRLWRHGDGSPFFATPAGSPNALVLLRVAGGAARQAPPTPTLAPAPSRITAAATDRADIGRLLFIRKPSGLMDTIAAIVYGPFCMVMAWYVGEHYLPQFTRELIVATGAGAVFFLLRALHSFTVRYRFYERGIVASALFARKRELRYGDVRRMSWGEMRSFIKGIYTGATTKARLVPAQGPPLRIRTRHYRSPDDDLDSVRDSIASNLADALHERLQSEGRVPWTRSVTLLHDGVELKRGTVVRYDEPVRIRISGAFLNFYRTSGWRIPIRQVAVGDENFFPGFALYRRLAKQVEYTA